jgi:hypothetical protein
MKKIRLDLERLDVDTFETGRAENPDRGTVQGHWSQVGTCSYDRFAATCQAGGTCAYTCGSRCVSTAVCLL